MLTLRRARLINWHFFTDSTVEFGPATLFAGDNGSGKSTIIDALQYALVANIGKIRFNAAATDSRTSRNLLGYCRCRIGSDTLDFLRGDCLTHVMLEFEELEKSFCAGILVEAFSDGETREHPWILEDGRIEDIQVYDDDTFRPPRVFIDGIRELGGRICSTKREYNNRLTHLLKVHRRNVHFNPYLESLVRSVNFTPVNSINDFVCSYILEERMVDITAMKENLANYRDAEAEARIMEKKIRDLEEIDEIDGECRRIERQILFQEYFKLRIDVEAWEESIRKIKAEREENGRKLTSLSSLLEENKQRKGRLEAQRQELQFALRTNDQHQLYERLSRDLRGLEEQAQRYRERRDRLESLIKECSAALGRALGGETGSDIEKEIEKTDTERGETDELLAAGGYETRELKERRRELAEELRQLEEGILTYPESTRELRKGLKKRGIRVRIFAELLEIIDPSWRNAVEGWLDTKRFDCIVPEEDFPEALGVYKKLPPRAGGAGLPNIAKMHGTEISAGSLAETVEASIPEARRYMAYLLGDVVRSDEKDLLNHHRAVTRDCMMYDAHRASRIREDVYSRWYIGEEAKRKRREELSREIEENRVTLEKSLSREAELKMRRDVLRGAYKTLHQCLELSGAGEALERVLREKEETEKMLAAIDTDAFKDLQLQITGFSESISQVEEEIEKVSIRFGEARSRSETLSLELSRAEAERQRYQAGLTGFLAEYETLIGDFEDYYAERIRTEKKSGGIDYPGIQVRYETSMTGLRTRLENTKRRLTERKNGFNHTFHIYLNTSYESGEFRETLVTYRDTELPEYREKIRRAREEAERQFREHFVSRLNEYILEARESFKDINYTLNGIRFGQDQYRFIMEERPDKRKILDVIKSAAEINQTDGTLFEVLTSDEEREGIEKLFSAILENEFDSPEVKEICDYREYFQYDIRIKHIETVDPTTGKPLESSLAKVLREKSGGETQTPYYVAIAASFYRFYKDEPKAVRLVLFDEAFNKMDDERIGKMIDFFKKLNMQVVTAVPTEKIESIAPYMDRTNLILRRDYAAFVRDYAVVPEKT